MRSLTHSLVMRRNSWHARWYNHWLSLGGKPKSSRENLCHYVRVLLFWAPARWLFMGRVLGVPPWTAYYIFYVGWMYFVSVYVGIGLTVLLLSVVGWLYLRRRDPDRAKRITQKVVSALKWVASRRVSKWYVNKRYFGFGITPIGATGILVVLAGLAAALYFAPLKTLLVLAIMAGVVGVVSLIVAGVIVAEKVAERRSKKHPSVSSVTLPDAEPKTRIRRAYRGTADTVKLGATYVQTKKRGSRICPFIEFDGSQKS